MLHDNKNFRMSILPVCDRDEALEPPKWLDVLENRRKRQHKLAHEIGAGSPCLICKEKCKGLNLHFWRKICIECKCKKEDHDFVENDDFVQFEILFGTQRSKSKPIYRTRNKTFDWVPQNASEELINDYFKAIPQSKLPITNSEGAVYRKQQLGKQLPIHDVYPDACDNLTEKEVIELKKYIENLKKNVVGQGRIIKFKHYNFCNEMKYLPDKIGRQEENANSSNSMGIQGQFICDQHPEVKTVFSEKVNTEFYPLESQTKMDFVNSNEVNSELIPNHLRVASPLCSKTKVADGFSSEGGRLNIRCQNNRTIAGNFIMDNPQTLTSSNMLSHNQTEESYSSNLNEQLPIELKASGSNLKSETLLCDSENNNTGATLNTTLEKFSELVMNQPPKLNITSSGEPWWNMKNQSSSTTVAEPVAFQKETLKLNIMTAPHFDVPTASLQECYKIQPKREPLLKDGGMSQGQGLTDNYIKNALVQVQKCSQCEETLAADDVVVTTERGGNFTLWHAKCFICDMCKELLVDLMYFYHDGKVYCGRDYAAIRNIPRCFACDELIFVHEYTHAEGKAYHVKHFCCFLCDVPLGGKQYIPKDNQPICLECYQNHYGKTCNTCANLIPVSDQRISIGELHFHVTQECFHCVHCFKFLKGGRLTLKNGKTFCSKECYQQYQN